MRHNSAGRRLGRTTSHRIAMFRNMVTSFLQHEKITTTDAKAKELRSIAEKMITLGKKGDLHATRQAAAYIRDKKVVTKLFTEIAPRYAERQGGYTRIIKLGIRPGDTAPVSVIELVEAELTPKKAAKPAAKAAKAKAPKAAPAVEAAPAAEEAAVVEEAPVAEAPAAETTEEKTEA
ncbi:50S ribosomal protein L17 [Geomonas azotofigens]|uniref:50S ribosomal protein L17 n=1 Tax=Geomonas azotofigens TaxID=2843196 RepID=UPI001C10CAB7|nr:50S ribosomal protein L17 [Geomonas azotofigens]MBU5615469.1 50S ribosomal protein L17 [Geomonas azotofigens]